MVFTGIRVPGVTSNMFLLMLYWLDEIVSYVFWDDGFLDRDENKKKLTIEGYMYETLHVCETLHDCYLPIFDQCLVHVFIMGLWGLWENHGAEWIYKVPY